MWLKRTMHVFWSIGGGYAISLLLPMIATVVVLLPRGRRVWFFRVQRVWARAVLLLCRVEVGVRQEVEIDWEQPLIVMSNHESQLDIPMLIVALHEMKVRFMTKHLIRWIPFFGWSVWAAGFVFIDRSNPEASRRSVDIAVERLRGGVSLVVFPEGTRSSGETMLPFKKGAFVLTVNSGVPVVPVYIRGSKEIQPKGQFVPSPGKVEVRIGAPMSPEGFTMETKDDFMANVRAEMERLGALGSDP